MAEGNAFHGDIANRTFGTTDDVNQRFHNGYNGLADGFALTWHIIELVGADVVIPLARFVEELFGIGEVERRGVTSIGCHWRGPGVFELNLRLGVVEGHSD